MAQRRNARKRIQRRGLRGRRGKTGRRGKAGPRGKAGARGPASKDHTDVVRLVELMEEVQRELRVQLTRIAQIQAQLDRFATGQAVYQVERPSKPRSSH